MRGVVRPLLGICCAGFLVCGCLITNPPDYDDPPDYHPSFVKVYPSEPFREFNLSDPSVEEFEVQVRDGNVDQAIAYRWFLNYSTKTVPYCGRVNQERKQGDGIQEIRESVRLEVNQTDARLTVGSCHRLTVVVTDGEWLETPLEGCATVEDGANRLVADWWLVVYDESVDPDEISIRDCRMLADSPEEDPLADEEPK